MIEYTEYVLSSMGMGLRVEFGVVLSIKLATIKLVYY